MNEATRTILLNKDIIGIDQDALGKQGFRVMRRDAVEAWKKPLSGGRVAIALLNRDSGDRSAAASWKELELVPGTRYTVYDVWGHTSLGPSSGPISAELKPHETRVFVLTP